VFDGNVAETRTLLPILGTVLERFPSVRRLILVADRGLLSLDNLEALRDIRLANGNPLEFILAVPGRRYHEFLETLKAFHENTCQGTTAEVATEQTWQDLRLVVAHDPVTAAEQTGRRNARINALLDQADAWAAKLDAQDLGENGRGRPLSDRGATARLYHAVAGACAGAVDPHPASPYSHCAGRSGHRRVDDQRRAGRDVQCVGGEETSGFAAVTAVVVEHFKTALNKNNQLRR